MLNRRVVVFLLLVEEMGSSWRVRTAHGSGTLTLVAALGSCCRGLPCSGGKYQPAVFLLTLFHSVIKKGDPKRNQTGKKVP